MGNGQNYIQTLAVRLLFWLSLCLFEWGAFRPFACTHLMSVCVCVCTAATMCEGRVACLLNPGWKASDFHWIDRPIALLSQLGLEYVILSPYAQTHSIRGFFPHLGKQGVWRSHSCESLFFPVPKALFLRKSSPKESHVLSLADGQAGRRRGRGFFFLPLAFFYLLQSHYLGVTWLNDFKRKKDYLT